MHFVRSFFLSVMFKNHIFVVLILLYIATNEVVDNKFDTSAWTVSIAMSDTSDHRRSSSLFCTRPGSIGMETPFVK